MPYCHGYAAFFSMCAIVYSVQIQYREGWLETMQFAYQVVPPVVVHSSRVGGAYYDSCGHWDTFYPAVIGYLEGRPGSATEICQAIVEREQKLSNSCAYCKLRSDNWKVMLTSRIAVLPKLSSYL